MYRTNLRLVATAYADAVFVAVTVKLGECDVKM